MAIKNARILYYLLYFMFVLHFLVVVSFCLLIMFSMVFSGGLDLVGYDFPGFNESCSILPFAFLLTLITVVTYPKLKNQKFALLLLISTLILNGILAIQVIRGWHLLL